MCDLVYESEAEMLAIPLTEAEMALAKNTCVCCTPPGFEMTEEKWQTIVDHWNSIGREFLGPKDVLALFINHQSPAS